MLKLIQSGKVVQTEPTYIIRMYKKGKRKPFIEVEVPNEKYFSELYNKIDECFDGTHIVKRFVEFYQVIFSVEEFYYAELVQE